MNCHKIAVGVKRIDSARSESIMRRRPKLYFLGVFCPPSALSSGLVIKQSDLLCSIVSA